jgi:hypothetical protein
MTAERFRALAGSSELRLEGVLRASRAPSLESLAGFEWRGWNQPWFTRVLGFQKFMKGFFRSGARVEGYNIPVRQNGLDGPWLPLPGPEAPRRFGFFTVTPVDPASRDNRYPAALLLNYGASLRNPRYAVERLLRDYLVQPDPEDPDVLLGKAYLALGPLRVLGGFFVLERLGPTEWKP